MQVIISRPILKDKVAKELWKNVYDKLGKTVLALLLLSSLLNLWKQTSE
jgi:hypothetical protein